MSSQGDFQLPGLRNNPNGLRVLVSSIIMAYSSLTNPRRLEDPLYVFWSNVLRYLIYDLEPEIAVGPQYKVYKAAEGFPRPDTSTLTDSGGETTGRTPDFTLLAVLLADRATKTFIRHSDYPSSFNDWSKAQVVISKPLGLFEGKRMPSRHHTKLIHFQKYLFGWMEEAVAGVEAQARIVFEEPSYNIETLVLIASSGEWWQFNFVNRSSFLKETVLIDKKTVLASIDNDDDKVKDPDYLVGDVKSSRKRPGFRMTHKAQNNIPKTTTKPVPKSTNMTRFTKIEAPYMARLQEQVQDALAEEGEWSDFILFGTRQSNQCLYLIHEQLKKMKRALQQEASQMLDKWIGKKDGYESEYEESEDELSAWP